MKATFKAQSITAGVIHNGYGLHLKIDDAKSLLDFLEQSKAISKVEVHVELDGETKEFTFNEFKERLGFTNAV